MKSGMVWVLAAGMVAGMAWAEEGAGEATGERTANGVLCHGDAAGEWTHDWDAAMAAAKADGGAVFANFTGSDWCGWCRLMDREVFSTDEWKEWAKESGVHFAWVDFPQEASLLPDEETKQRNGKLAKTYGVRGYPTYLLVDGDGNAVWRGGASREPKPEQFIGELEEALAGMRSGMAWRDGKTGLEFPKTLGGMEFAERHASGGGIVLRYRVAGTESEWADVYVDGFGAADIGEGASPAAKEQVEWLLRLGLQMEKEGRAENLRLGDGTYTMKIGGVTYQASWMQFDVPQSGNGVDATVAVTGRGNAFVKVRYSRPHGEGFAEARGMTENLKALMRDLGAVMAP